MELDVEEGADIIMVKPALFYLDIIRLAKERINRPIAAYSVSGEYTMIKNTARAGYLDYRRTVMEAMTAVKRAGADILITYFAKELAQWMKEWEARHTRHLTPNTRPFTPHTPFP